MIAQRKFSSWQEVDVTELSGLESFYRQQLSRLSKKQIFLFYGEVGAGKTESVKTMARIWQLRDVASPSFAIHHAYENSQHRLDHIDLYRLESEDELEGTGFWDLFTQESSLIVIEWPERLEADWLPLDWKVNEYYYSAKPSPSGNERKIRYRKQLS